MTETRAAYEAVTLEAMHTGDYTAPDLEYTPISAPLPQMVRREELEAMRGERDSLRIECALLRAERDQLRGIRDTLEAERNAANARAEAAEARVAELEAHLAARQRRAELDAADIGPLCPACGYELDADGWCAMCAESEVQS